jgi:hypothetical protein
MRKKQVITNGDDVISALMKKAQELNDPELLAMAASLSKKPKQIKKKATKKKPKVQKVEIYEEPEDEVVESVPKRKRTDDKSDDDKRAVRFSKYKPPKGPNRFQDDGITGRDAEDERLKKLGFNRGKTRPKFGLVQATCSNCGGKEKVHPMFNTEFFKCDKCSRKPV